MSPRRRRKKRKSGKNAGHAPVSPPKSPREGDEARLKELRDALARGVSDEAMISSIRSPSMPDFTRLRQTNVLPGERRPTSSSGRRRVDDDSGARRKRPPVTHERTAKRQEAAEIEDHGDGMALGGTRSSSLQKIDFMGLRPAVPPADVAMAHVGQPKRTVRKYFLLAIGIVIVLGTLVMMAWQLGYL